MIEIALGGKAAPATSYLYERNPDYARASTVYSYDPDKARAEAWTWTWASGNGSGC